MTEPTKKDEAQVEQWHRDAAQGIITLGVNRYNGYVPVIEDCAEIIARHAPKRDEAVEELVKVNMGAIAVLTNTDLDAEETITLLFKHLDEWRSALAALKEGK